MNHTQPDDTKCCPKCAETIKAKAVLCRYCNYEFPIVQTEKIDSPPESTNPYKNRDEKTVYYFIVVIVISIAIYILNQSRLDPAENDLPLSPPVKERLPALIGSALVSAAKLEVDSVQQSLRSPQRTVTNAADLKVENWHWSENYSYAIVEGLVTNNSQLPIENLLAVANYYTQNGEFITSDSALIEYRPIMVNQSSPFKIMTPFNPRMHTVSLEFKTFDGKQIPWDDGKNEKKEVPDNSDERLSEIIQGYLKFLGYLDGEISRKCDRPTSEGIRKFQKSYKLNVTGSCSIDLAAQLRIAAERIPVGIEEAKANP